MGASSRELEDLYRSKYAGFRRALATATGSSERLMLVSRRRSSVGLPDGRRIVMRRRLALGFGGFRFASLWMSVGGTPLFRYRRLPRLVSSSRRAIPSSPASCAICRGRSWSADRPRSAYGRGMSRRTRAWIRLAGRAFRGWQRRSARGSSVLPLRLGRESPRSAGERGRCRPVWYCT